MGATPIYLDEPLPDWDPSAGYPPAAIRAELGRRLQARMVARGWNQSELARQALTGRDNISAYIRGRALPGAAILARLAAALDCVASDLLPAPIGAAAARPGSPLDEAIPLELRQVGGGKVWLRLNRALTLDQATRILAIVNEG